MNDGPHHHEGGMSERTGSSEYKVYLTVLNNMSMTGDHHIN